MRCDGISCTADEQGRDDNTVIYACSACSEMWEEPLEDVNRGHEDDNTPPAAEGVAEKH